MHGLEDDYRTFSKRGEMGDHDLWGQHLQNLIRGRLGDYALSLVGWDFYKNNGSDLVRINVNPSDHPVYDTQGDQEIFWRRTPVGTISVTDPRERERIVAALGGGSDWAPSPPA